ncbi:hypothetical protein PQX77_007983 [Marasmius sp. AFHP31]|nr:hypothetical protein PQX77_007983 [Marasmius sp. AFHP31]
MKHGIPKVKCPMQWKVNRIVKKKSHQVQSWGAATSSEQESMPMYTYTVDSDSWQQSELELSPSKKRRKLDTEREEDSGGVAAIKESDPFMNETVVTAGQQAEEDWVDEPAATDGEGK